MTSIDLSEKTKKNALEIQDKFRSEMKSENFFSTIFFSNKSFSKPKFCLGLDFVLD